MVRKRYVLKFNRKMLCARYGLGWSYATETGGAVLKTEVSWKNINGIWINWPAGCIFLLFRRPSY